MASALETFWRHAQYAVDQEKQLEGKEIFFYIYI